MIDALLLLASAAPGEEETSKTFFYVAGSALAGWAVLLAVLGLGKADWPSSRGPERGVIGITAVLVALTAVASIVTG